MASTSTRDGGAGRSLLLKLNAREGTRGNGLDPDVSDKPITPRDIESTIASIIIAANTDSVRHQDHSVLYIPVMCLGHVTIRQTTTSDIVRLGPTPLRDKTLIILTQSV
jgi:hypothetical protein